MSFFANFWPSIVILWEWLSRLRQPWYQGMIMCLYRYVIRYMVKSFSGYLSVQALLRAKRTLTLLLVGISGICKLHYFHVSVSVDSYFGNKIVLLDREKLVMNYFKVLQFGKNDAIPKFISGPYQLRSKFWLYFQQSVAQEFVRYTWPNSATKHLNFEELYTVNLYFGYNWLARLTVRQNWYFYSTPSGYVDVLWSLNPFLFSYYLEYCRLPLKFEYHIVSLNISMEHV